MYDAVWLYALAVNETLESGQSIRNGLEVAKRTYNRLYEGRLFCIFSSVAKGLISVKSCRNSIGVNIW